MDNRFFPFVIAAIMLTLGLTLTVSDFRRATTMKRPLLVALVCQSVLLPSFCLGIAELLDLTPNLAVGLMLMAATPGGTLANVLSHLANGDLALNLTLTAINAVLAIFAIPTILAVAMTWFLGDGHFIPLQYDKFFMVFAIVLIPTAIGIAIRHRFPDLARRLQNPVKIAAAVLLVVAVAAAFAKGQSTLWNNFGVLSLAVVCFCAVSLTVGYLVPRFMRLAPPQAIAISLEIGLHNSVVAVGIALSPQLLNNFEMATPPAVYGILSPLIALTFLFLVRRFDRAFRATSRSEAPA